MASSGADRLSLRAREIVLAARELLEEEGLDALTMRRLADRLGIRAPSLYKHFADKQVLEAELISDAFREQAAAFEQAVAGSRDPLHALTVAYREFARAHPHLYRLMTERPLQRDLLADGVEARAAAPLLEAVGGDTGLARAAWAFAHGMTNLELNGRFTPEADLDAAWNAGVAALNSRVRSRAPEAHSRRAG
jgi:AcrR family transcriptional regulator